MFSLLFVFCLNKLPKLSRSFNTSTPRTTASQHPSTPHPLPQHRESLSHLHQNSSLWCRLAISTLFSLLCFASQVFLVVLCCPAFLHFCLVSEVALVFSKEELFDFCFTMNLTNFPMHFSDLQSMTNEIDKIKNLRLLQNITIH